MQPHIEFRNVTKRYRIGRNLPSLRSAFSNRDSSKAPAYHYAVQDVSFQLHPGEALGVIGPNGAGKTTILKLLSRVTRPTSGEIRINGRLSALIELGAGFHPDLTGRENIFLNGTILGMRRNEIKKRFDDIVDFAGIGEYLDTPVKRYSSGMYARLGFAIAAHVDPQILLVDEVLAVGDYAFQAKCYQRMDYLREQGTSLIFVSHNMEAVRRVCDRGLVMYRGENIFQGSSPEAVLAYSDAIREAARNAQSDVPQEHGLSQKVMTFDAEVAGVSLQDLDGNIANTIRGGDKAVIAMDVIFHKDIERPIFAFFIRKPDGKLMYNITTKWLKMETPRFKAGERCRVNFHINVPLLDGPYELGVDIAADDLTHYYDRVERALGFVVKNPSGAKGTVDLGATVSIQPLPAVEEEVV